jgi:hypothetical protein
VCLLGCSSYGCDVTVCPDCNRLQRHNFIQIQNVLKFTLPRTHSCSRETLFYLQSKRKVSTQTCDTTADKNERLCNNSSANCCKLKKKYMQMEIISSVFHYLSKATFRTPSILRKRQTTISYFKILHRKVNRIYLMVLVLTQCCVTTLFSGFGRMRYPHLKTDWIS